MKDDSATMDEVAHLPAGYSYLTQKDMRLNSEHPPLLKDLAAIPLLFIRGIEFPSDINAWKTDVNGQWDFGFHFLYQSGNPVDEMVFWGRIPMILILILLGFYIFKWAKELFGNKVAILALFLFSFSPTFLAHGRLITTDVGAAFGVFVATYYFLKALSQSTKKNLVFSGIFLGIALLLKFSTMLLIPFFIFLGIIWWLIKSGKFWRTVRIGFFVFLIGFVLIWVVYSVHVLNYPPERQLRDTKFILTSYAGGPSSIEEPCFSIKKILRCPAEIDIWASDKPLLRSLAQYGLGLLVIFQRAAGGHTTYFLGEVSAAGWKSYFPIVYLIKEPLALHILTLIAISCAAWPICPPLLLRKKDSSRTNYQESSGGWAYTFQRIKGWIKSHFPEFAMILFIGIYWATSLASNLNIGVRHLLPTFPFTFVLVSAVIINWLTHTPNFGREVRIKYVLVGILILWQVISVISIYPHFLAYFNEIAEGPDNGYIYAVNSNLDWGQDLKRLEKWVDDNKIEKIYVDYFGGGDAEYYLEEKFVPWWGQRDPKEFPKENYLAVSATFLQGGRGEPAPGFNQSYGYYLWLNNYRPIAKIGYSIFIYYIK